MAFPHNQFYEDQYSTDIGFDGDATALFQDWEDASEQARQSLTCDLALHYGDANRETVDIFYTEDSKKWLIFIHGGYWAHMTSGHFHFMASALVESGWNVAFIEYDLCPAVTIQTIVNQCRRGIAWVANRYSEQIDEFVISGHSAGGHLTGMIWTTDWDAFGLNSTIITGGIAVSSLFDLDPIAHTKRNGHLNLSIEDVHHLSPARLQPTITAPLVITAGALESAEFQRQNHLLRGIPEWAAITSDPLSLDGYHHYNILEPLTDINSRMWDTLCQMQQS